MTKKRFFIKAIVFVLIFAFIWGVLSAVINYKWDTTIEKLAARYEAFEAEPEGTIDVFFIGSSPSYEAYVPAQMYHETGITAINFGTSNNRPITEYYNLMYALKHQTPKVVVLDGMGLYDIVYEDYSARDFIENVPDIGIKNATVKAIHEEYPDQDLLPYYLPLLHYHARWDELKREDFDRNTENRVYNDYLKGNFMIYGTEVHSDDEPELLDTPGITISDTHTKYLKMIIDECRSRDIEVIMVVLPGFSTTVTEYEYMKDLAKNENIRFWDMNDRDIWPEIGITAGESFHDVDHLNYVGSGLYSTYFAHKLSEEVGLTDHRGDPAYEDWERAYYEYASAYEVMGPEEEK